MLWKKHYVMLRALCYKKEDIGGTERVRAEREWRREGRERENEGEREEEQGEKKKEREEKKEKKNERITLGILKTLGKPSIPWA